VARTARRLLEQPSDTRERDAAASGHEA